ncbi:MAG: hypothetical protein QOI66_216 [Myxococcales bacterium]|jgi:hypothetical protein|nr:hypothetical protein [Myxococcales bacterium]
MTALWLWATIALMAPAMASPAAPTGARSLTVDGAATCPTAAEVALRLSSLLAPADSGDRVRIDTVDDAVEIVLRRADGTLIGRRRLQAQGPCDERARIAAIVLATWESDIHPAFEREAAPPPEPPAPSPAPAADVAKPMPTVPVAPAPARWELGVGAATSLAGGTFVAGARVAGAFVRASGIGAQMMIAGEGDRSTTAGSGQAVWSRLTAGAGPVYRRHLGVWAVDGNLALVAALFRVHGEQYPVGYQGSGWDGGFAAGVRLIAPGKVWRPWLAIDATRWLDRRDVREAVSGQARELPAWAASTSLGVSFFGR